MNFLQKEELMMYLETVVTPQHSPKDHHIESHRDHDDGRQRERESPHRNSLTESKATALDFIRHHYYSLWKNRHFYVISSSTF